MVKLDLERRWNSPSGRKAQLSHRAATTNDVGITLPKKGGTFFRLLFLFLTAHRHRTCTPSRLKHLSLSFSNKSGPFQSHKTKPVSLVAQFRHRSATHIRQSKVNNKTQTSHSLIRNRVIHHHAKFSLRVIVIVESQHLSLPTTRASPRV